MMYHAAIAGKGVDAVVYVGMNNGEMYPTWFGQELLDGALIIDNAGAVALYLFDEFDIPMIGPTLIPGKTVVIRNRNLDIITINIETFEKLYYVVGPHRAALKEDCIEYYAFWPTTIKYDIPGWIFEMWISGKVQNIQKKWETSIILDGAGKEHEKHCLYVMVVNRHKQVKCLKYSGEFDVDYEADLPYRPDWAFEPLDTNIRFLHVKQDGLTNNFSF